MKEMDEKELLDSTLRELGGKFRVDESGNRRLSMNYQFYFDYGKLGIKLKPKQAEVTQDNLCRFYLKYKEWPQARFWTMAPNRNKDSELMSISSMSVMDASGELFDGANINDPRWYKLEGE